jgi:hypothetical protein
MYHQKIAYIEGNYWAIRELGNMKVQCLGDNTVKWEDPVNINVAFDRYRCQWSGHGVTHGPKISMPVPHYPLGNTENGAVQWCSIFEPIRFLKRRCIFLRLFQKITDIDDCEAVQKEKKLKFLILNMYFSQKLIIRIAH